VTEVGLNIIDRRKIISPVDNPYPISHVRGVYPRCNYKILMSHSLVVCSSHVNNTTAFVKFVTAVIDLHHLR